MTEYSVEITDAAFVGIHRCGLWISPDHFALLSSDSLELYANSVSRRSPAIEGQHPVEISPAISWARLGPEGFSSKPVAAECRSPSAASGNDSGRPAAADRRRCRVDCRNSQRNSMSPARVLEKLLDIPVSIHSTSLMGISRWLDAGQQQRMWEAPAGAGCFAYR